MAQEGVAQGTTCPVQAVSVSSAGPTIGESAPAPADAHLSGYSNSWSAQHDSHIKVNATQQAHKQLQRSPSAGSSPLPQMTTRKRPREAAVQQADVPAGTATSKAEASVPVEIFGPNAADSKADALPGTSPRPRRAKVPANQQRPDGLAVPEQKGFSSLSLIEQVAIPELVLLAEENSIVWCRVKGFPAWPVSSRCSV